MCIISCSEFIKGYYAGQKITATSLSEKYNLNIRTLNPALNKMTRAGILKSQVGGIDRGYIFARDPKEISVYDVIDAIQGLEYMKCCTELVHEATCERGTCEGCKLFQNTNSIVDFARERFKNTTVYDLFNDDNK